MQPAPHPKEIKKFLKNVKQHEIRKIEASLVFGDVNTLLAAVIKSEIDLVCSDEQPQ